MPKTDCFWLHLAMPFFELYFVAQEKLLCLMKVAATVCVCVHTCVHGGGTIYKIQILDLMCFQAFRKLGASY